MFKMKMKALFKGVGNIGWFAIIGNIWTREYQK
jgi:hypothetical protein